MRRRPCCVPGCGDQTVARHAIPSNYRLREIWIDRIANPKLQGSEDKHFLHNYVVCNKHFADMCFDQSGRLLLYSLPTVNLPEYQEPSMKQTCFSYPPTSVFVTSDKVKKILSTILPTSHLRERNLNVMEDEVFEVKLPVRTYSRKRTSKHLDFEAGPSKVCVLETLTTKNVDDGSYLEELLDVLVLP